ncbi:hypothetical protein Droror1_Dr00028073 [Drosera rotundifolia]
MLNWALKESSSTRGAVEKKDRYQVSRADFIGEWTPAEEDQFIKPKPHASMWKLFLDAFYGKGESRFCLLESRKGQALRLSDSNEVNLQKSSESESQAPLKGRAKGQGKQSKVRDKQDVLIKHRLQQAQVKDPLRLNAFIPLSRTNKAVAKPWFKGSECSPSHPFFLSGSQRGNRGQSETRLSLFGMRSFCLSYSLYCNSLPTPALRYTIHIPQRLIFIYIWFYRDQARDLLALIARK